MAIGRIPVTSDEARLMAEEESTPVEEMWAIPVESEVKSTVPLRKVVPVPLAGAILMLPVVKPPRVRD